MLNESKRDFLNSEPRIFFFPGRRCMYVATVVNNCIASHEKFSFIQPWKIGRHEISVSNKWNILYVVWYAEMKDNKML